MELVSQGPACQGSPQQGVGFLASAFILPVMPGTASGTVTDALRLNASIQLPHEPPETCQVLEQEQEQATSALWPATIPNGKGTSQVPEYHSLIYILELVQLGS